MFCLFFLLSNFGTRSAETRPKKKKKSLEIMDASGGGKTMVKGLMTEKWSKKERKKMQDKPKVKEGELRTNEREW